MSKEMKMYWVGGTSYCEVRATNREEAYELFEDGRYEIEWELDYVEGPQDPTLQCDDDPPVVSHIDSSCSFVPKRPNNSPLTVDQILEHLDIIENLFDVVSPQLALESFRRFLQERR